MHVHAVCMLIYISFCISSPNLQVLITHNALVAMSPCFDGNVFMLHSTIFFSITAVSSAISTHMSLNGTRYLTFHEHSIHFVCFLYAYIYMTFYMYLVFLCPCTKKFQSLDILQNLF